ncbi:MAG: hypothetical protein LCH52_03800 [Bacteroidetes bacterium]|nr:hypothetical protein [Bacteroidota bacterium]
MEKVKTFWERYTVQIITVTVIIVGFYFTTNAKLESNKEVLSNHETRLKLVEIQTAQNNVILERLEIKVSDINKKLDRLIEAKGIK